MYLKSAGLTSVDRNALTEAGFVPIRVNKLEDVKVLDPMEFGDKGIVWLSAMEAIAKSNNLKEGPKTMFGRLLAEKLSQVSISGQV